MHYRKSVASGKFLGGLECGLLGHSSRRFRISKVHVYNLDLKFKSIPIHVILLFKLIRQNCINTPELICVTFFRVWKAKYCPGIDKARNSKLWYLRPHYVCSRTGFKPKPTRCWQGVNVSCTIVANISCQIYARKYMHAQSSEGYLLLLPWSESIGVVSLQNFEMKDIFYI